MQIECVRGGQDARWELAVGEGVGLHCPLYSEQCFSGTRDRASSPHTLLPDPARCVPAPPALSFSLVIFAIAPLDGRVRAAAVL